MNPVYDFTAVDHAAMLGDSIRLELYRRAIENQVKPNTIVVEVGTGTGILSSYAATQTTATVSAIEFADYSADLAEKMMKAAGFDHVKIIRGESTKVTLNPEPSVLITETIGALGPEENIVEICRDFKKRHPSLKTIIPAKLKIYAEPIQSQKVEETKADFYQAYEIASRPAFHYDAIREDLAKIWESRIRYAPLAGSVSKADRTLLVEYQLGETESASFSTDVDLRDLDANAVHLYFEAELDQDTLLSTHFDDPITHWGNAYVSRPKGAQKLVVSYSSPSPALKTRWVF